MDGSADSDSAFLSVGGLCTVPVNTAADSKPGQQRVPGNSRVPPLSVAPCRHVNDAA